jgi:DNA end-binding protein Ku
MGPGVASGQEDPMRSIWKGAISFGLVTIPVKLYSATEQKDVTFHQVHRTDGGRIRYKRVCTIDGEEVPYADIAKGYELASGEMVVLTDEDFEGLPLSTSRRIDVLQFSPEEQIDPILFNKSYYLEPEAAGTKPYVLLRDALEGSGRVAIVKVALRQRESLAVLRVREEVFLLETMLWPDEIREADFAFLEEDIEVRAQELQMASSLIDTMTGDFDPSEYRDAYREALQQVIEAKIAGKEVVQPEAPPEERPAVDLMAALRASVEAAKKGRATGTDDAKRPAAKAAKAAKDARPEPEEDKEAKPEKAKPTPKRRPRKTA